MENFMIWGQTHPFELAAAVVFLMAFLATRGKKEK